MTENVAQTTERLMRIIAEQQILLGRFNSHYYLQRLRALKEDNKVLREAILASIGTKGLFIPVEELLCNESFKKLDRDVRAIILRRYLSHGDN